MRKITTFLLIILAAITVTRVLAQDETPTPAPASAGQGVQIASYLGTDIFDRADTARLAGNYDEALSDYSLFILLNPTDSQSHFFRGLTYYSMKDYDNALADLTEALALPAVSKDLTGRTYYLRATIYLLQQQTEKALTDLSDGIQASPAFAGLYEQRGRIYYTQNKLEDALADFDQWVNLEPDSANAYALRGVVNAQLQNYDQAVSDYTQLIELSPNEMIAYSERAQAYIALKNYELALADLDQALKLEPRAIELYLLRGSVNNNLGHQGQAAQDYLEWARRQHIDTNRDLHLRPGESQVVQLEANKIYLMSLQGKAGQKVTITANARSGQQTDPILVLIDNQVNALIADDDSGGNFDAAIKDFVLPSDGEYYLLLSQGGGSGDGPVRVLYQIER